MQATLHAVARKTRDLNAVSRQAHCLNDLLFRWRTGQLPMDVVGLVSNHMTCAALVGHYGLPFHHEPLPGGANAAAKPAQEQRIEALMPSSRLSCWGWRATCGPRRALAGGASHSDEWA